MIPLLTHRPVFTMLRHTENKSVLSVRQRKGIHRERGKIIGYQNRSQAWTVEQGEQRPKWISVP